MRRCKLNISLVFLSTIAIACKDDDRIGAAGATETGGAAEAGETDGLDGNADASGLDGTGDGDGDSGDGDGDPAGGDGDGDGDSGGTATGDGDGDGDGDMPVCGDGVIDPGEECDDGADNGDEFACLSDCTLNICGDGFVGPEEGCDDGNLIDGDGCTATCTLENVPPGAILCGKKLFECGDTVDNDDDGFTDLDDPECISPCDDVESSFETKLPGQNKDCRSDCFFDENSGVGDDGCSWNLKCDLENPGEDIGCAYNENFGMCSNEPSEACIAFCQPLVPKGCDCFGCCLIEDKYVYLDGSPDCNLDSINDANNPEACKSCTFNDNCGNP